MLKKLPQTVAEINIPPEPFTRKTGNYFAAWAV